MSEGFDPYHAWLGIQPKDQPPHHYRLLAIEAFESHPDVIENAADQRMAHIRRFQSGRRSDLSQRILNEIAAAKLCLLNANQKAAYDQQLRAKLQPPPVAPPPVGKPLPAARPPVKKAAKPSSVPPAINLQTTEGSVGLPKRSVQPAVFIAILAVVAIAALGIAIGALLRSGGEELELATKDAKTAAHTSNGADRSGWDPADGQEAPAITPGDPVPPSAIQADTDGPVTPSDKPTPAVPTRPAAQDALGDTASFTAPDASHGLELIDREDGRYRTTVIRRTPIVRARGWYLYFQIDDDFLHDVPKDDKLRTVLTLTVFDGNPGSIQIQYDGYPVDASDGYGYWLPSAKQLLTGSGSWKTLSFELPRGRFANRQHNQGDFRLVFSGDFRVALRDISVRRVPPSDPADSTFLVPREVPASLPPRRVNSA